MVVPVAIGRAGAGIAHRPGDVDRAAENGRVGRRQAHRREVFGRDDDLHLRGGGAGIVALVGALVDVVVVVGRHQHVPAAGTVGRYGEGLASVHRLARRQGLGVVVVGEKDVVAIAEDRVL